MGKLRNFFSNALYIVVTLIAIITTGAIFILVGFIAKVIVKLILYGWGLL